MHRDDFASLCETQETQQSSSVEDLLPALHALSPRAQPESTALLLEAILAEGLAVITMQGERDLATVPKRARP